MEERVNVASARIRNKVAAAWLIFFPRIGDSHCDRPFIPLSPLSVVSTMVMWESNQRLGKNSVQSTGYLKIQESVGSCTGRRDITEIYLKTALNTIQLIN